MTTYNTGNPVGSTDPRDLYDNAEVFDRAINDPSQTFTDRLGNERPTLKRLESDYPMAGVYAGQAAQSAFDAASEKDLATSAKTAAEAARDAAFVNANVYADIPTGRAAVTDGAQFAVVAGDEIVRYRRDSSTTQTEVARFPSKGFVDGITLFPGRAAWVTPEPVALSRILSIQLFGADPAKFYFVKFHFWKDAGTRYTIVIQRADDDIGTGAVDVAQRIVSSGADTWNTIREIDLAATGGSGITGTAQVDFRDPAALTMNVAPSTAAMFQRRRLNSAILQIGTARQADIGARAASALGIRNQVSLVSAFAGGAGNDTQTGQRNTGFGYTAADSLTTGEDNTAVGLSALTTVTTGNQNTAVGSGSLELATGSGNTATGFQSLRTLNNGANNAAHGFQAGFSLTTGGSNAAFGYRALFSCASGGFNTALGLSALQTYTGSGATAVGSDAAYSATTATNLTAIGRRAAYLKTTGGDCTYVGFQAGWSGVVKTDTGVGNTAIGAYSLGHNTSGQYNTGCGRASGWYGDNATKNSWLGYRCGYGVATGNDNVAAGFYALHNLSVGNRNTMLGSEADAFVPNATGITATAVAGSGLSIGAHAYRVSFVIDGVETALSEPPVNATTTAGNQQVNLATIPVYVGPRVCSARRIYRTPVGGENLYYLVGTLADNTTTTFSDTTPDASLATQPDALNNSIALGYGAKVLKSGQMVVGSSASGARITEVIIGGGVDDTAPSAMTMGSSNASGTNVAGADLRLRAGTSTGNGLPGRVILAAAAPGSSGTTHNATVDWVALDGRGFLNIKETAAASVPTPAAGSVNLFIEGGALKFRVSSGDVKTVSAS